MAILSHASGTTSGKDVVTKQRENASLWSNLVACKIHWAFHHIVIVNQNLKHVQMISARLLFKQHETETLPENIWFNPANLNASVDIMSVILNGYLRFALWLASFLINYTVQIVPDAIANDAENQGNEVGIR